jgi:sigma-B regulation protein RsbU (phosphoserine phosphatase)
MGHGTRASLLAAFLRGLMEQVTPLAGDPGTFMKNLNTGLAGAMKQYEHGVFVTAFYMVADIREGVVRYTNAGHPDPLVIWSIQRVVTQLNEGKQRKRAPALGLLKDYKYSTSLLKIAENDIVFCFTDGLYEVMNSEGTVFGRSRLQELTREKCVPDPDALLEKLLLEVRHFYGTAELKDDICLLSMHVRRLQSGAKN